jgi:hypothetical protein
VVWKFKITQGVALGCMIGIDWREITQGVALGWMIGIDWREITQGVALGCLLVVPSALEEGSGVVSGYRWPSSDPE